MKPLRYITGLVVLVLLGSSFSLGGIHAADRSAGFPQIAVTDTGLNDRPGCRLEENTTFRLTTPTIGDSVEKILEAYRPLRSR